MKHDAATRNCGQNPDGTSSELFPWVQVVATICLDRLNLTLRELIGQGRYSEPCWGFQ